VSARSKVRRWPSATLVLLGALLTVGAALAGHGSGGHGGGSTSSGAGSHSGGGEKAAGNGSRGGGHFSYHRGRGNPAIPGNSGPRGGYYAGYAGWGSWGGIGLGWYLPVLPWGFETLWWGGTPYYFADNAYYVWDGDVGEYQQVEPPPALSGPAPAPASVAGANPEPAPDFHAYPNAGQSEAQQARDRDECRRWASEQTGGGPGQTPETADALARHQEYLRAVAACLSGRNYTVN